MQATGAKREATGCPPHLLHCHSSAQHSDLLLFQLGKELGCNKIVTGDTATAMAVRVIAETSKVRLTRGVHVGSGHVGMWACGYAGMFCVAVRVIAETSESGLTGVHVGTGCIHTAWHHQPIQVLPSTSPPPMLVSRLPMPCPTMSRRAMPY